MKLEWPAGLIDHYERLRTHVISGNATQAHGWFLFIRYGMRAWGDACQALPTTRQILPTDAAPSTPMVPRSVGEAVVQVLAGMVLHFQQEAHYG